MLRCYNMSAPHAIRHLGILLAFLPHAVRLAPVALLGPRLALAPAPHPLIILAFLIRAWDFQPTADSIAYHDPCMKATSEDGQREYVKERKRQSREKIRM